MEVDGRNEVLASPSIEGEGVMKVIWKFEIRVDDEVLFQAPKGTEFISVGCQSERDTICLWGVVDLDAEVIVPYITYLVFIRGTGHLLNETIETFCKFLGTVQTPSGLV